MYRYDEYDHKIINERVDQYRDQVRRYLAGELPRAEFLPLRLQNGLYQQRIAHMLRIAVPYGLLSSDKFRKLAQITREYDKGYAHVTTRQNIQLNWPELPETPDILSELASVEMHAVQTSGNCIRNTTADHFAGVAADEYLDPRPYCELIRQWSTFHPEFAYLPRKFKIAVCGSETDRSAIYLNDIGVELMVREDGAVGYRMIVGGGLGRTPVIGAVINDFVAEEHLLTYLTAIIRVYNQFGRRDNKFKARIKILVRALGVEKYAAMVEEEWLTMKDGPMTLTREEITRVKDFFQGPAYETLEDGDATLSLNAQASQNVAFANWLKQNTHAHKKPGYRAVTLSLKRTGIAPGNITDAQMEAVADLADRYSFGELRTTHEQNIVLADVKKSDLFALWQQLHALDLATANIGTLNDIISCPGGDFCSLANAKSIPVAEAIQREFDDLDYLYDLGHIELNISGCMNACSHHHLGHIGILGVDKKGEEYFQVSLGGSQGKDASLGKIVGPSFAADEIPKVVRKLVEVFVAHRQPEEPFLQTYRRIGIEPFKEAVYAQNH